MKKIIYLLFIISSIQNTLGQHNFTYCTHIKNGYLKYFLIKKDTIFIKSMGGVNPNTFAYAYSKKNDTLFLQNNEFINKIIIKNKRRIKIYYKNVIKKKYIIAYKNNIWLWIRNFVYSSTHNTRQEI